MAFLDWLQQMLGGGQAGEDTAASGRLADMQPGVNQWLQNVASGDYVRQGLPSNYDPNRSFAQNALDPGSLENALNVALGIGGGSGLGIKAYHGSPYDFNAFDASKIGTGEGAQAYGHGLYFAEAEPAAQAYRDNLSNLQLHVNGEKVGEVGALGTDPTANAAHALFVNNGMPSRAKNYVQQSMDRRAQGNYGFSQDEGNAVLRAIDDIGSAKVEARPGGRMYEVNINADPEQFLNWDKPLSEQPQAVKDALRSTPWGGDYLNTSFTGGQVVPKTVEGSQQLQQAGIPGIRYLDQGSRGAGQGTSNYVVFDPSIIEILRKYGIIPPAVGVGLLGAADQQ